MIFGSKNVPKNQHKMHVFINYICKLWVMALEDRKYGYFWIFPHHSCENIQKYFEFLDTFGYSPIIPEQLSDVLGGRSPP